MLSLNRVCAGLAVLAGMIISNLSATLPASAEVICAEQNWRGTCLIQESIATTDVGGSAAAAAAATTGSGGGAAVAPRECMFAGSVIPCSTPAGSWSGFAAAWCRVMDPQPALSDPAWGSNTSGAIYLCTRPGGSLVPDPAFVYTRWLPAAPEVEVDPRAVALQLLASLGLEAIDLGMFPAGDNEVRLSFVGWNVWLWAEAPSAQQWGPLTASDSASGVTVSLSAEVDRVEWDMGDGTVVTCGRGTEWSAARTNGGRNVASPNCGHVFEAMGTYQVTATSHWDVAWSGAGRSGTLPFSLARSADYLVGEYQVLNG